MSGHITSAMWDAYAEAAYKLTGTKPTELERAGMEAAYGVIADTVDDLCRYIRDAAGPVTMLVPVTTMEEITARIESLVGALRRIAEPEVTGYGYFSPSPLEIASEALGESGSGLVVPPKQPPPQE